MSWSEERLHRWLEANPPGPPLTGSAGHDAAVLRKLRRAPVVCFDQTVEGVHVALDAPARQLARKAVARVLSDLAATAARPRAVGLALGAPADASERRLRDVLRHVRETARGFGAELVGGDLTQRDGPLALAVTALGELASDRRPPGRDRARPGQCLLVTGPVGGSEWGRHWKFEPRLEQGAWLHARGATALMDVSDGLALDLWRLARASSVRARLTQVPVHRDARRSARRSGRRPIEHALADGEDYELLVSLDRARVAGVLRAARRRGWNLTEIGEVERGRGLDLALEGEEPARFLDRPPRGWIHGE